jgi:hypothetical protein
MMKPLGRFGPASLTLAVGAALIAGSVAAPPAAIALPNKALQDIQLDHLDRGLVAARTTEGVFLSWRLLATEVTGATETGQTGADFVVYRDGQKIADVTDSTNFLDEAGGPGARYAVASVVNGQEVDRSDEVNSWADNYFDIPLTKPADGITPAGKPYSYDAGDMSIGDADGDGENEYIVKWEPTNAADVSVVGYTGNTFIDTYTMQGKLLHRIDLGVNIRAGEHYTQFMVYDFDGDGRSEMMMKTAPGTKITSYDASGQVTEERYITLPQDDIEAGITNSDDYRMSSSGYYEHLVGVFEAWHEHPEVVAGNWPSTLEEAFGIEKRFDYPLSDADARSLTDYFIDVYAPSRSTRNNLRAFEGFILSGPEYLTVFDGASGEELKTVDYEPGRSDDGLLWGDYAYARIEPGNRVDRFLAGVAYLDGQRPSAIFARGYYTRSTMVAYNWDGENLSKQWSIDSGHVPMTNPFNDAPHGKDGSSPEFGAFAAQGFHSLSAADVDDDGRQEVVYGSATVDDNGSLLYSSTATLPEGSVAPGQTAKLGHGDQLHVTDIDPDRPGLEIYTVHENARSAPYGYALRDAANGEVLYGAYSGRDTGRGLIGDVDPAVRGIETWSIGMRSASGEDLGTRIPGTNMNIKWAADMTTQVVNGSGNQTPTIDDWKRGRLLTAQGTLRPTGHKNPNLVADAVGDWREELFLRTIDSSAIRVYMSTEVTDYKLTTLLHDPQYRVEVARQNMTYNQPSYTSYYLASDMNFQDVPVPGLWTPGLVADLKSTLEAYIAAGAVAGPVSKQLQAALSQAESGVEQPSADTVQKAISRFLDHLGRNKKPDTVSEEARVELTNKAQILQRMTQ